MQKLVVTLVVLTACAWVSSAYAGAGWTSTVTATNTVVSPPVQGGGYPVPPAHRARARNLPAGPVQREPLRVVARGQAGDRGPRRRSKFFFEKYSTF